MRLTRIVLASTAALAVVAGGSLAGHDAAFADGHVDTSDRTSVTEAYNRLWTPSLQVQPGWTGSTETCEAGGISASAQSATLTAINFARDLAGLTPAEFVPAYDQQAQAAALIVRANGIATHTPAPSSRCYTAAGNTGAGSSNLYPGTAAAAAVAGYLVDPGSTNTFVGHRRWVLNPDGTRLGHGSTDASDALKVFGDLGFAEAYSNPRWVSWPTSGYFPVEMEPNGRWSLSGQRGEHYDFSAASVTVRDATGASLPVQVMPQRDGYGADTLVWQVAGLKAPVGTDVAAYSVDVQDVVSEGTRTSSTYTVRLFDPEATTAPPTSSTPDVRVLQSRPVIAGKGEVGSRLTVTRPVYSPAATDHRYRWYRSGHAIAKAVKRTYTLTKKDRGKSISVRVTVPASGGLPAATSKATLRGRVR